jgi:hypothetical protein
MRDREVIDQELALLAAVSSSTREQGGQPTSGPQSGSVRRVPR